MDKEAEKIIESLAHLVSVEDHLVYVPSQVALLRSVRKERQRLTLLLYEIINYEPRKENSELHCILKHLLVAQTNLREAIQRWGLENVSTASASNILDELTSLVFEVVEKMSNTREGDVIDDERS